ncbi:hypothetical protein V8C86DRAFT_2446954, partial [Haematococcus lacustris]
WQRPPPPTRGCGCLSASCETTRCSNADLAPSGQPSWQRPPHPTRGCGCLSASCETTRCSNADLAPSGQPRGAAGAAEDQSPPLSLEGRLRLRSLCRRCRASAAKPFGDSCYITTRQPPREQGPSCVLLLKRRLQSQLLPPQRRPKHKPGPPPLDSREQASSCVLLLKSRPHSQLLPPQTRPKHHQEDQPLDSRRHANQLIQPQQQARDESEAEVAIKWTTA